ncbi:MAG: hypothetical protein LBG71_05975 [Clostridiales Family XIII bacterium]|jgi:UDP-3-O-[3-hydroxymyristoyl] glucosamine N-acyltransferase|nr:hypothetical protein [Clostridiales Family XIII bacterium]
MFDLREILDNMGVAADFGGAGGELAFSRLGLCHIVAPRPCLSFVDDVRYIADVKDYGNIFLTSAEVAAQCPRLRAAVVESPRRVFFNLHNFLADGDAYRRPQRPNRIGAGCKISPLAYVADHNVTIGDRVVIEEFVSIKENTVIGDNARVRAGSVIGGDGFEYKREGGRVVAVRHLGGVVIEEAVTIASNTCVDKAIFPEDDTVLKKGCKIDNLVYIAHAAVIGEGSFLVAGTTIGGRAVVGRNVFVGMNASVRNGASVGDDVFIGMGVAVTADVGDGARVTLGRGR